MLVDECIILSRDQLVQDRKLRRDMYCCRFTRFLYLWFQGLNMNWEPLLCHPEVVKLYLVIGFAQSIGQSLARKEVRSFSF